METQTVADGQTCALNVAASDILSVALVNGAFVITLKDGTKTTVQATASDPSSVSFELTGGEIYTAQDLEAMFAMAAPEDLYDSSIQEATYQPAPQQQTKAEPQPAALNATAEGDQALMDQLAAELAEVEAAAGDEGGAASSSGSGFNSTFASQAVEGLDDIGALQRTQLEYGVENRADDTKCGCGDLPDLEPKLAIDSVQLVYEDGSVRVMMTATPDSATGILTITIVGIPPTWTVTGEGTYNASTMTWTFTTTPGQIFNGGPTLTPPADSDVDLNNLTVTVSEYDPNTGQRGSYTTTIDVMVDAVADTPTVNGEDSQGLEDTPVDVKITGAPGDTDGSETIQKFVVSGVPNGFTLSAGTDLGNGSWELSPAQINGLKLNAPHNFHGDVQLSVTIHTAETVTDQDFDLTNNTAQATDTLTVTFIPVADPPVVTVDLPKGEDCGCPGNDGLVAQVYEDKTIDVKFSAVRDAGATADEYLTVTVSGVDLTKLEAGSFTISGQHGATWTRVPGSPDTAASFTITLPKGTDYQGTMHFKPKADSDIDLNDIVVSATAHEPSSDTTADAVPVDFDVIVDAVADKPVIDAQDATRSDGGIVIPITITGGLGSDKDGSESISHYQISGVPNGFTFNQGTNIGNGVWQFTPAQIGGLTISSNNPAFAGSLNLTATIFNKDNPTDKDFDTTNNTNSSSDKFCVTWNAPPVAVDDVYKVYDVAANSWDAAPGSTVITNPHANLDGWSSKHHLKTYHLEDGVTVHEDTNNFNKGWWYKLPVLQNDSDPNGDPIKIVDLQFVSGISYNREWRISDDGKFILFRVGPDGEKYNKTFTWDDITVLQYTITDGHGGYDTAKVTIKSWDATSPLVFDLNRNGVELLSNENGVLFDMDNDGIVDKTGWAAPTDGMLALDVNNDGIINNQSELFGNSNEFDHGFAKLASYDHNQDGVIDSNDEIFAKLLIWQDMNSDGFSDAGELFSLTSLNIASISLSVSEVSYMLNGNAVTHAATFTYNDGTTGEVIDAWFETSKAPPKNVQTGEDGVADTFVFESGNHQSDIVQGFNADEGDVLDISALLEEYDPLQDAIDDFVFSTTTDDGSTILAVDASGSGDASAAVQFAVLEGVTTSIDELSLKSAFVTA